MEKVNNDKYIFRCDRSGVFYGELVEIKMSGSRYGYAKIKNSRKIRYWDGANCLEQLSVDGTQKPKSCEITVSVDTNEVFDFIQLLKCTDKAKKSLDGVKEWKY